MQDDIRAQLIRQFPSEVVETADAEGTLYYACPTCRRPVAMRQEKCIGCGLCADACPKHVVRLRDDIAYICDTCKGDPNCVKTCPHNALTFK